MQAKFLRKGEGEPGNKATYWDPSTEICSVILRVAIIRGAERFLGNTVWSIIKNRSIKKDREMTKT